VPVLLGDARTGACAAVHAGWRGTLARVVKRALAAMREEFGTEARDVRAAIGPAALSCCYEVGHEVIEAFRSKFSNADALFAPTREGHALVDLHRANREQLVESGVAIERIHALPLCTICRPELFFSYRRDRKLYGRSGRLLSVIGRR
jgi:YfiH family protein